MSQPSDSRAIMDLALELGQLAQADKNEFKYRSAVSRAYYAVFLLARDTMNVPASDSHSVHTDVQNAFKQREPSKLVRDDYHKLKELRKSADYDFPAKEDHKEWDKNWQFAATKAPWLLDKCKKLAR